MLPQSYGTDVPFGCENSGKYLFVISSITRSLKIHGHGKLGVDRKMCSKVI